MWYPSRAGFVVVLLLSVSSFIACESPPPTDAAEEQSPTTVVMRQSSSGAFLRQDTMEARLSTITRALSVALADDQVRGQLYESLRESPYSERKRHFRTLVARDAPALADSLASAAGVSRSALQAQLDSVIDLEIYLPVAQHRDDWRGGKNLIVGSIMSDDGRAPTGFTVGGQPVELSIDEPPATPTLMLAPVETDFNATESGVGLEGEVAASSTEGIYATRLSIDDDSWDTWPFGNPEFEYHAFLEDSGTGDLVVVNCSGESRSGQRYFNYDDTPHLWQGNVLITTQSEIADGKYEMQIWENDSGPCKDNGDGRPPKTDTNWAQLIGEQVSDIVKVVIVWVDSTSTWLEKLGATLDAVDSVYDIVTQGQKDDYIATVQWPVHGCWPASTGSVTTDLVDDEGNLVGTASINATYGERTPLCAVSAWITGPTEIETCESWIIPADPEPDYEANFSGGSGSVSYQWFEDGVLEGTSSTYTLQDLSEGDHALELRVIRDGDFDYDFITVAVDELDPNTCGSGF